MSQDDLEALYREQGPRLWRALLAYSASREIADDAMAEAFAQALRRGDEIKDAQAWVWRAAFKIAAGELKDRSRMSPSQDGPVFAPESDDEVLKALEALSPRQRACILLHHYAGYPVKEVATILDTSTGAVKVHLSIGRKRLRTRLVGERDA
jgi:RNA polymerase sigma factor (sigma-70 family)